MRGSLSGTVVILFLGLCSCAALHEPAAFKETTPNDATVKVPIVRPGMTPQEVETLMGRGVVENAPGLGADYTIGTYRDVKVEYVGDRVRSCSSRPTTILQPNHGPRITMYLLEKILRPGMSPEEVEGFSGPPKFGYENKPRTVALVYPLTGIEIVFIDGKSSKWTKIYTFEKSGP